MVIGREPGPQIELPGPNELHGRSARIPIRLRGEGLSADGVIELEEWSGGLDRFFAFFDDLADGWRGWSGTKQWRDDGATVRFDATHDGIGLITFRVTLRSLPFDATGSWRTEAFVPVEPGVIGAIALEMRALG